MVRTCALGASRSHGMHAVVTVNAPLTLTFIILSYRRLSVSATVFGQCVVALLITTSMRPHFLTTWFNAKSTCPGSVMSHRTPMTQSSSSRTLRHRSHASPMVPGRAELGVQDVASSATFAPLCARRTATASPMPRLAPVTTTTLSSRVKAHPRRNSSHSSPSSTDGRSPTDRAATRQRSSAANKGVSVRPRHSRMSSLTGGGAF
mmetsp:Transcript_6567/g.28893  ORF Transcript_6567/g.28893 Transcript_6567/m.28893 type:complete len:205 (-) Transcript_6567:633-1247(-)